MQKAAGQLRADRDRYKDFCKEKGLATHNENTQVLEYDKSKSMRTIWAEKALTERTNSNIIGTTTNAVGQTVTIVKKRTLTGEPNSITQVENNKGGIDRNYYGEDGRQTKQITNNNHGNAKRHPFGQNGEHGHDYKENEDGKLIHLSARELTEEERKENADIL
ncbi:MAG: hypothetical protein IJ149_06635 [Oscillospiraceae bacterium]|nr:hypothetical protein [Oscillospiraceae bacterium]